MATALGSRKVAKYRDITKPNRRHAFIKTCVRFSEIRTNHDVQGTPILGGHIRPFAQHPQYDIPGSNEMPASGFLLVSRCTERNLLS